MFETIAIISNGLVVVAIGALYAKINSHGKELKNYGKELNNHVVYTVEEITKRPDFDQMDKRICTKLKPINNDLHEIKIKLFDHLLETK